LSLHTKKGIRLTSVLLPDYGLGWNRYWQGRDQLGERTFDRRIEAAGIEPVIDINEEIVNNKKGSVMLKLIKPKQVKSMLLI
jgi:hypothetical protein